MVTGNCSSHLGFKPTTLSICCAVKSTDYGVGLSINVKMRAQGSGFMVKSKVNYTTEQNRTHSLTNEHTEGSVIWLCFWEECSVLGCGRECVASWASLFKGMW